MFFKCHNCGNNVDFFMREIMYFGGFESFDYSFCQKSFEKFVYNTQVNGNTKSIPSHGKSRYYLWFNLTHLAFSPILSLSIKKPDSWYVDIEYSDMETAFTWVKWQREMVFLYWEKSKICCVERRSELNIPQPGISPASGRGVNGTSQNFTVPWEGPFKSLIYKDPFKYGLCEEASQFHVYLLSTVFKRLFSIVS